MLDIVVTRGPLQPGPSACACAFRPLAIVPATEIVYVPMRNEIVDVPSCPGTPDADDPDREATLATIAEWEAKWGSRRRLDRSPAPPQWRPVESDDPRPWLEKTLRTVRGRGPWRTTELWELPFPELRKAWNTWLVYRKNGPSTLDWCCEYEFYWWGYWEDFERGGC